MTGWLVVLGFAVASSVDNFGVGLSYGIRNIKISKSANGVIALICFLFSIASTYLGNWLSLVLPGILPIIVGALFIFFIGLRIVLLVPQQSAEQNEAESNKLDNLLKHPELADTDLSGEISMREAMLLGIALSLNALTNGLGAGLLECTAVTLSLTTAAGSFLSLWAGAKLGKKVANTKIGSFNLGDFSTLLSGIILILIAVKTALL